ncbi:hypothetical protein [Capnocytophaga ochracea]|uniref:hypothetical protein n=1 Tax=Capnocytophaga ochracea TaxID=1018 RepID=UPI0021622B12|nr:hypothetical protein [Capnocytophaga ochracea]
MWRVFYSVSPRTPEGGQAGKADKPPPLHIPSYRWLFSKEETVASLLFGKPPNPRRGTSWKS